MVSTRVGVIEMSSKIKTLDFVKFILKMKYVTWYDMIEDSFSYHLKNNIVKVLLQSRRCEM